MHSARGWGSKGRSDLVPSLKGYSLGGVEVRGVRAHQRNVCSNVATRDVSTWLGEPRAGQDQVMTLYVCCEDEQRKSFCLLKQSSRTRGARKSQPGFRKRPQGSVSPSLDPCGHSFPWQEWMWVSQGGWHSSMFMATSAGFRLGTSPNPMGV